MIDIEEMRLKSWWVGVDPGTDSSRPSRMGQVALLDEDFTEVHYYPTHEIKECQELLKGLRECFLGVCIEEVSPRFSKPYGDSMRWHDRCVWLDLRHAMVPPVRWQKLLGEHKKKGDKNSSVEYVRAQFPGHLAASVGRNTGKADALVLAIYGERLWSKRK
jgi:hypothetical protein